MADVKGFLKKAFPFIATAASFGGPIGNMAAAAVGKALGVEKVDPSPDGVADALAKAGATPEQIAALENAEKEFQLKMQTLGYEHIEDLERLAAEDRASARDREKAVKDWMPKALGLGAFCLLGAVIIFLLTRELPQTAKDTLLVVLGVLVSAVKDVYGYYFGSSAGSDAKTQLLANGGKQ